jgi:hypothetical protein
LERLFAAHGAKFEESAKKEYAERLKEAKKTTQAKQDPPKNFTNSIGRKFELSPRAGFAGIRLADRNRGWLLADGWEMTYTSWVLPRQ